MNGNRPVTQARIAIVGAGAVGGYLGAYLARAGVDVVLIDSWPAHVEAIRAGGLRIDAMEPDGCFVTPARALHICDVPQLGREAPFDVALICVKSYDTDWATMLILPYLAPDGCVVSVQNSINEERIAAIAGWSRTLGCCVNVLAAELVAPGHVVRNSLRGDNRKIGLAIGEPHGRVTRRAETLAELFAGADTTRVTTNLWGERWSKLTINAMRNGVCAMTGMTSRERDGDPRGLSLSIRLGSQSVRVGQAQGLVVEEVAGLDLETLGRAEHGDRRRNNAVAVEQGGADEDHDNGGPEAKSSTCCTRARTRSVPRWRRISRKAAAPRPRRSTGWWRGAARKSAWRRRCTRG